MLRPSTPQIPLGTSASEPYSEASDNLATLGYLLAIVFPLAGLIIGIVLLGRGRSRAGWQIVVISLIAPIVIFLAIAFIAGAASA